MWNKKKVIKELKTLRTKWSMGECTLQTVIDYILLHPKSVRKDFYTAMLNTDLYHEGKNG